MDYSLIVATSISAIFAFLGTLIGTKSGIKHSANLTNYKIEQLEIKVEKHNNLVERTYGLEKNKEVVDEKIKVINHRIADLQQVTTKGK